MITIPSKIPIIIHPLFWLVAFFIGWTSSENLSETFLATVIILISVIFHELGHALTAIVFGQKTRIELAVFGGFTYREGRKLKLWEEFLVVMSGPMAGFLLVISAYTVHHITSIENQFFIYVIKFTFMANLFWTVMNLVPVLPLDGGHLLSIFLEALFGFKGVKSALYVGIVIAITLTIIFFALEFFLIGAIFLILTFESVRSIRYYKMFSEKDRDIEIQELLKLANQDLEAGNFQSALKQFREVRIRTKQGLLYLMATQEMAEIYRNQGNYKEGYAVLIPIKKNLTGEFLALFHFLAYMNGDFKTVFDISNQCFQESPSYNTALINALACGALTEVEAAIGWLECAFREGLPSIAQAIQREEFNSIRHDTRFLEFQKIHA